MGVVSCSESAGDVGVGLDGRSGRRGRSVFEERPLFRGVTLVAAVFLFSIVESSRDGRGGRPRVVGVSGRA